MTDDEWGGIAERIASTWPTGAADPARYRAALDHLDPAAVEAGLDALLLDPRTGAPPTAVLRERAEGVAPAAIAPVGPVACDDDARPGTGDPPAGRRPEPGPERRSTRATAALVLGVAGLVTIPVVVSVAALVVARGALAEIAADPGLGGARRARTGRALGWIGLAIMAVTIVVGIVAGLAD